MGWKRAALAAVVALLSSCEPAREGAAPAPAASGDSSNLVAGSRRVRLPVRGDFAVAPALPDTELTTVSATKLSVGDGSVGHFAVARPRVRAGCIVEVQLRLFVEGWTELAGEELAVYPSSVVNALHKRDGDRYGYSGSLLDVRPRGIFRGVTSGWAEWDVTAIVKLWSAGGAFPSRGVYVPEHGPVVLALRDVDLAEPFATATVASVESSRPPEVFAFVEESCPPVGRA